MKYNGELKFIDNPKKAYFLGFLYGDGCITEYLDGKRVRYEVKVSIHEKDENLIKLLKNEFPFFSIGKFDYSKYNKNSGKQVYLRISSIELFNDLMLNGLLTRKSYENKENLKLPLLNKKLLSHFIRGFFDADGSVFKMKYRKNLIKVEITSNSKNFINELDSFLKNNEINSWKIVEKKATGKGRQEYYNISIIKINEILKFKEFLYKDATIFLERKKKIFDEFKLIDKVMDRNISCPNCSSYDTKRNGVRNNKNRMKCNDCGKGFTK
jgi:hypothetical protein